MHESERLNAANFLAINGFANFAHDFFNDHDRDFNFELKRSRRPFKFVEYSSRFCLTAFLF